MPIGCREGGPRLPGRLIGGGISSAQWLSRVGGRAVPGEGTQKEEATFGT